MRQKFLLTKNINKNELKLEEQSELEPGKYSTLYENLYDLDEIRIAEQGSTELLKRAILNNSFYPASNMADLVIAGIRDLLISETEDTLEVLTQDKEVHIKEEEEKPENDAEETVKLDSLLDDAIEYDEGLTEELEIEPNESDSSDLDAEKSLDKKGTKDKSQDSSKDNK